MPSKEEKRRRAQIVQAIVAKETKEAIEKCQYLLQSLGRYLII